MSLSSFVPEDMPEYNVRMDIASAQKVYDSWPTEIVTAPVEVGSRVDYPASEKSPSTASHIWRLVVRVGVDGSDFSG